MHDHSNIGDIYSTKTKINSNTLTTTYHQKLFENWIVVEHFIQMFGTDSYFCGNNTIYFLIKFYNSIENLNKFAIET